MSASRSPRIATLSLVAVLVTIVVTGGCSDPAPDNDPPAAAQDARVTRAETPPDTTRPDTLDAAVEPTPVAPSFDCDDPDLGDVETLICSDSALATLDVRLDSVWSVALERARGTAMPQMWVDEMRDYQSEWFDSRDACSTASEQMEWASLLDAEAMYLCTETAYRERIAHLQADWGLAEITVGPVFWVCGDDPSNAFVTTFFATDPEAVRVERGTQTEVFLRTPTASGARYQGLFGKEFWDRGGVASFVWPEGETRICSVRN